MTTIRDVWSLGPLGREANAAPHFLDAAVKLIAYVSVDFRASFTVFSAVYCAVYVTAEKKLGRSSSRSSLSAAASVRELHGRPIGKIFWEKRWRWR